MAGHEFLNPLGIPKRYIDVTGDDPEVLWTPPAIRNNLHFDLHAVWWPYRGCLTTPQLSRYQAVVAKPLKRSGDTIM